MKIIKYYRKNIYGKTLEYVAKENDADAFLIKGLTGQSTINPNIRILITELSGKNVQFQEIIAPL